MGRTRHSVSQCRSDSRRAYRNRRTRRRTRGRRIHVSAAKRAFLFLSLFYPKKLFLDGTTREASVFLQNLMAEMTCNTKAQHFVFICSCKSNRRARRHASFVHMWTMFSRARNCFCHEHSNSLATRLHMWDDRVPARRRAPGFACLPLLEGDSGRFITEHSVSESNFILCH